MSEFEGVPRGFENPYQYFVWKELSVIRELERTGQFYRALQLSVSLLKYLQPEVRKKQERKAKIVLDKVKQTIRETRGSNIFETHVNKNRVAQTLGSVFLEQILTLLSDQLGSRAYMEKKGILPRVKKPGRLKSN